MSSGNDNRLKIGEKSPKPIGKGTQIQKIKINNLSSIIDANRTIYRFATENVFWQWKKYKGLIAFNFLGYVLYYIR